MTNIIIIRYVCIRLLNSNSRIFKISLYLLIFTVNCSSVNVSQCLQCFAMTVKRIQAVTPHTLFFFFICIFHFLAACLHYLSVCKHADFSGFSTLFLSHQYKFVNSSQDLLLCFYCFYTSRQHTLINVSMLFGKQPSLQSACMCCKTSIFIMSHVFLLN